MAVNIINKLVDLSSIDRTQLNNPDHPLFQGQFLSSIDTFSFPMKQFDGSREYANVEFIDMTGDFDCYMIPVITTYNTTPVNPTANDPYFSMYLFIVPFNTSTYSRTVHVRTLYPTGASYIDTYTVGETSSYKYVSYWVYRVLYGGGHIVPKKTFDEIFAEYKVNDRRGVSGIFPTGGQSLAEDIIYIMSNGSPYIEDDDPYADVPANEGAGGGGIFDDSSDPFGIPPLPSISVSDAGFVTIFNPSLTQLKGLSDYLWSPLFDPDTLKKIYANPIDVILGLSILPISIPASTTKTVNIGGVNTGVAMSVADQQFIDVDFGTLTVVGGSGNTYLDYEPYTKASIFLPYIGWRDLSIDEVMDRTLHLVYRIDIVTGGCCAMLVCGDATLYEFQGQCAIQVPVTSVDFATTISSAISAVGHIGSAVVGVAGGFGGAVSGGASGGVAGALAGVGQAAASAMNGLSGLASDVMNAKPQFPRSGSLGGTAGVLGHQQACLCITRPRIVRPKTQNQFMGYPSFVTKFLSELEGTGYNSFESVKIEGVGLTSSELMELENILKGGVYL